jgi:hypothetical protein
MITKRALLLISSLGAVGVAVVGLTRWQFSLEETAGTAGSGPELKNPSTNPHKNSAYKGDTTRKLDQSSELRTELTGVRSQLKTLEHQQQLLDSRLQRSEAVSAAPENHSVMATAPEEELAHAEMETQAQIDYLQETVITEEVDQEWAKASTLALEETLQHKELKGLHLVHADCRKTLCQLVLNLQEGSEESLRKLPFFVPWAGEAFFHTDGQTGETLIFIAREGHTLPSRRAE